MGMGIYRRVLLKLSGEALLGSQSFGIDESVIQELANQIKKIWETGVEIGIVIGGGNIIRGVAASAMGIERVTGDHMGMLGTVINALALQDALEKRSMDTRVMSAIDVRDVAEPFILRRAVRHLEKKRIVIFAAGTGNPYFTTDSAAALRANEIGAEVLLKATNVRGVFDSDPKLNPEATFLPFVTYQEVLEKNLKVMDAAAIALCRDNGIPIVVFDLKRQSNILRAVLGESVGTLVTESRSIDPRPQSPSA